MSNEKMQTDRSSQCKTIWLQTELREKRFQLILKLPGAWFVSCEG
jgi:hypothetical protein